MKSNRPEGSPTRRSSVKVTFGASKLQHIYDLHAGDFGLAGNRNSEQLEKLRDAIESHVNQADTRLVFGRYRGREAKLFYNAKTQNVIVTDESNNLVAGFRASLAQAGYITLSGRLT